MALKKINEAIFVVIDKIRGTQDFSTLWLYARGPTKENTFNVDKVIKYEIILRLHVHVYCVNVFIH